MTLDPIEAQPTVAHADAMERFVTVVGTVGNAPRKPKNTANSIELTGHPFRQFWQNSLIFAGLVFITHIFPHSVTLEQASYASVRAGTFLLSFQRELSPL